MLHQLLMQRRMLRANRVKENIPIALMKSSRSSDSKRFCLVYASACAIISVLSKCEAVWRVIY
jgi:hypothetical protein